MLVFCVFPEQLLSHIIFGRLNCYEVTLVKKYNKYIRFYQIIVNYVMLKFNSVASINAVQLQKLANQSMLNDVLEIEDGKQFL